MDFPVYQKILLEKTKQKKLFFTIGKHTQHAVKSLTYSFCVFPSGFQIKSESFLEDVNNILNSGDVPNLYTSEEQERILIAMKPVVQDMGQQPTKANLMAAYIKRVRSNIHTVLCMRFIIISIHLFIFHCYKYSVQNYCMQNSKF